jgi:hypothetical protein
MQNDIIKQIVEADGAAAQPIRKDPLVAKLLENEPTAKANHTGLVGKLVSAFPPEQEKQKGPVTVIMQTPYTISKANSLVKALTHINKTIGKIGEVLFEGAFAVGQKLPKLARKYEFTVCVRDHPHHLMLYKHFGGSGRFKNPMEEVRERLDDDGRLLRRGEEDAFMDMLDMVKGVAVVVLMPGSTRTAASEHLATAAQIPVVLADQQKGLTYVDDIIMARPPVTLLVITSDDYADIGALLAARTHLNHLGLTVGKIVYTPSMAMEVISGLGDGTLYDEIDLNQATASPLKIFDVHRPDYIVVAGNSNLAAAVINIAAHKTPVIPCADLS